MTTIKILNTTKGIVVVKGDRLWGVDRDGQEVGISYHIDPVVLKKLEVEMPLEDGDARSLAYAALKKMNKEIIDALGHLKGE